MKWKILALVAGFLIVLVLISHSLVEYSLLNISFKITTSLNTIYINQTYNNYKFVVFIYSKSKINIDITPNYLNFLKNLPLQTRLNLIIYVTPINATLQNLYSKLAVYELKTFSNGILMLNVSNNTFNTYLIIRYNNSDRLNPSVFNVTLNVPEKEYKIWVIWRESGFGGNSVTTPVVK